jgi:hypothetical protein
MDTSEVVTEAFSTDSVAGYAIVPPIERKKVVFPCPPSVEYVPINPRSAVLYLTESAIVPESTEAEQLKAYALENNIVLVLPEAGRSAVELVEAYAWTKENAYELNVAEEQISIKSDEISLELARAVVSAAEDEDFEIEDAEVLAMASNE